MKTFFLGIFSLMIYSSCIAQDKVYSLKDCVEIAIANNLQLKQNNLLVQNAEINYKQARENQIPNLFANLNHGLNEGRSIDPFTNSYINQSVGYGNYNLSSEVTLFNGFQLKNLIRQTNSFYQSTTMELQAQKDNLTLNVILAYLQVLTNQDLVLQAQTQSNLTKKQVERLTVLNDQGAIIPAQLYDMKGQAATDALAIIANENALANAKLSLTQMMNIGFEKNMLLKNLSADDTLPDFPKNPDAIYELAASALPLIKAVKLRTQTAATAVKVARGQLYPSISLSGNLFTNYSSVATKDVFLNSVQVPSGDFVNVGTNSLPVITKKNNYNSQKINYIDQFSNNYNTSVNLNIRIPIFNGMSARNNIALAKNDLKNSTYLEEIAKQQLKQSIEQATLNVEASEKKYTTLVQQVADFTESFRIAEVRFNAGVSNQVEYLIASNNLALAKNNLISTRYDYIFRMKILDYYEGKLTL